MTAAVPLANGRPTATATVRCPWCAWAQTVRGDLLEIARILGEDYAAHIVTHHPEQIAPPRVES